MLYRFGNIRNFALGARDGEIGKIKELYFEEQHWVTRYVTADTGGWLESRLVLLAPHLLGSADMERKQITTRLTRAEVQKTPGPGSERSILPPAEMQWHSSYEYPPFWFAPEAIRLNVIRPMDEAVEKKPRLEPHLCSTGEVTGYSVHADDGYVGHIHDYVIDLKTWRIPFITVTLNWRPIRKIIVSTAVITEINWDKMEVRAQPPGEVIRNAPAWHDSEPITSAFAEHLASYYSPQGVH